MSKTKPKRRRARVSDPELDDFVFGATEAISEQLMIQQFNAIWGQMETAPRLELELLFAAAGAVGHALVCMAEALESLKKGKAPTMTMSIGKRKRALLKAACDFAKRGTYKKKRKTNKDRDKRRYKPGHGTTKPAPK